MNSRVIQDSIKSNQEALDSARQSLADKHVVLTMESLKAASEFSGKFVKALVLVRRELGMEIDETAYLTMTKGGRGQLEEHLQQMVERTRKLLESD